MQERERLLEKLSERVGRLAVAGRLTGGKPIQIRGRRSIIGPRAGAVELAAGLDTGVLLRALAQNECARLRALLTWDFAGAPTCYMSGRYVRLEAGWPARLAESKILLSDANQRPDESWRWLAGKLESGGTIRPGLYDATTNWLVAGQTGAGKSMAMQSALLQLANGHNELVLIDGKFGEGLGPVAHLAGVVGPVATDLKTAQIALMWAIAEMRKRYEAGGYTSKIVVAVDEFQEFAADAAFAELMRKLTAQGRAAGVHMLLGTQHPSLEIFGSTVTRRNLPGRIALRVADYDASKVATGSSSVRADLLLGAGDAYVITPSAAHRTQLFYVSGADFETGDGWQWPIPDWHELDIAPEDMGMGNLPPERGVKKCPTMPEIGAALLAANRGDGRPAFERWLAENGMAIPGSDRSYQIHKGGKDLFAWLRGQGVVLSDLESALPPKKHSKRAGKGGAKGRTGQGNGGEKNETE